MLPSFYFLLTVLFWRTCVCQQLEPCNNVVIGHPDSNIMKRDQQNKFNFTTYPALSPNMGDPRYVADEHHNLADALWAKHGYKTKCDSEAICALTVNLRKPYYIRGFAVTGYTGGSLKPTGSFFLQGSIDGNTWKMVAEGEADQWHAPGTYPFRPSQIVPALYPGRYQFYRVTAKGWTNGWMLMQNLGLFT